MAKQTRYSYYRIIFCLLLTYIVTSIVFYHDTLIPSLQEVNVTVNNKINKTQYKWDGIQELEENIISFNLNTNYIKSNCAISGTVIILTTSLRNDLKQLKINLQALISNFYIFNKMKYCYPITIYHEDLKNKTINKIIKYLNDNTEGNYFKYITIYFVKIKFWIPNHIKTTIGNKRLIAHFNYNSSDILVHYHGLHKWHKRNSFGYYHMCRFWMCLHNLNHMKQFKYYLRLDTDSFCHTNMPNYFEYAFKNKYKYLYYKIKPDHPAVTENLLHVTNTYIKQNNLRLKYRQSNHILNELKDNYSIQSKYCFDDKYKEIKTFSDFKQFYRNMNNGKEFEIKYEFDNIESYVDLQVHGCNKNEEFKFQYIPAYATNFEVVNMDIFKCEKYNNFIEYIDQIGGIYQYRWGDAPLRYIALNLILNENETYKVNGCLHPQNKYLKKIK
eukprot:302910_1